MAADGAATGTPTLILDTISDVAGATLYRNASMWVGLNPGAHYKVLRMGVAFPEWDTLDGNSFGSQPQQAFFGGPVSGGAGIPSFINYGGQLPATATNDNAAAGNLGEIIQSSIAVGSAVALVSGTPKDITSIVLTPGDWDVWGQVATNVAAGTTTSVIRGWINTASATDPTAPNGGAYLLDQQSFAAGLSQVRPLGKMRISVATGGNQTVYLSTAVTFAVSTLSAYGYLGARRVR